MIKIAELFKGCISALALDGTFNGLIAGRVYTAVPRSPTFPFVRIVSLPTSPADGRLVSGHVDWIWEQTLDFTVFSLSRSPVEVSNVLDALGEVIEDKSKITVLNMDVVQSKPGLMAIEQDETTQTWSGVLSFTFLLDETD